MTTWQAIISATLGAADLLKKNDQLGSISVGKLADLIAIDEDPSLKIETLEKVGFVMLNGEVIKNDFLVDSTNDHQKKKRKLV